MSNSPPNDAGLSSSQSSASVTPLSSVSSETSLNSSGKSRSPSVKASNVFSNDGSFLDRVRRSLKEEEDKKKAQDALERKKNFADRFTQRGKRQLSTPEPPEASRSEDAQGDTTANETPAQKKRKTTDAELDTKEQDDNQKDAEQKEKEDTSAQAEYHRAIDSYPSSLKDSGTGVRSLIK